MTTHSPKYYWRHNDLSWIGRPGDSNTRSENYDEEEVLPLWLTELTCLIEVFGEFDVD